MDQSALGKTWRKRCVTIYKHPERKKKKTQISVKNILKKFKNGTLFIHSRKHGAVFG